MNFPNNVFSYNFTSLFDNRELSFDDMSSKMHIIMFGLVYGLTVAVIISSFLYKKKINTDYIKETQTNCEKDSVNEDESESEYEKDSDDDKSSVSSQDDDKKEKSMVDFVNEQLPEQYPELSSLFQYSLTRRQLVKIVGYKYRNMKKKDLVKLAIEKVKSDAINNALENFKYFNPTLKSYVKTNRRVYQIELQQLFGNSENNFNKNLVNNNG